MRSLTETERMADPEKGAIAMPIHPPGEFSRQSNFVSDLDRKFFENNPGREFHIRRSMLHEVGGGRFTLVWQAKPGARVRQTFDVHKPLRDPVDTEECGRQWFDYLLHEEEWFANAVEAVRDAV